MTRLRQKIHRERERERVPSRSSERAWPQINQVWASHDTTILQTCNTKIKEKQLATPWGLTGSMISAALKHADVSCWGRTWLHVQTLSVRLQVQIRAPARNRHTADTRRCAGTIWASFCSLYNVGSINPEQKGPQPQLARHKQNLSAFILTQQTLWW